MAAVVRVSKAWRARLKGWALRPLKKGAGAAAAALVEGPTRLLLPRTKGVLFADATKGGTTREVARRLRLLPSEPPLVLPRLQALHARPPLLVVLPRAAVVLAMVATTAMTSE